VVIYSVAVLLLLWRYALPVGLFGAMVGVTAGVLAAHVMARMKMRAGVVVCAGVGAVVVGVVAGWLLTHPELVAGTVGVGATLYLSDFFEFGLGAAGVALALRGLAIRWSWVSLLEVALVTSVVCMLVADHRDNAISEPRALSDWAWSHGHDPTMLLLGLGALTLVTVPMMLLVRQRAMKAALSVSALIFLGLVVFLFLQVERPGAAPPHDPIGLTGKEKQEKDDAAAAAAGSNEGASGTENDEEMPFKDEYPRGEAKPVAIVLFHDDYRSPEGYYYFRQATFSQYNGYRLVRPFVRGADLDVPARFPSGRVEVLIPGYGEGSLTEPKLVPTKVALMAEHRRPFGLLNLRAIISVANPNPRHFRRAYEVESVAQTADWESLLRRDAGDPGWSTELQSLYLGHPDDDRYRALADEITAELQPDWRDKPVTQALAIKRWLEKNSFYTRKSSHAGSPDPVASFLFGSRRGYCVHLSHAMAFLLRSRGIPARVSAGYAVPEERREGGSALLIQNQDAHAWAEMYLTGFGWVVVDVSPEQADEDGSQPFNRDLQRTYGELARGDEAAGRVKSEDESRFDMTYAGLVVGPLLFLLLALSYLVKLYRRVAVRFVAAGSLYRVAFRGGLDRLAEVGLLRGYGETREAFARRVAARAPALEPLTRAHLARAFGDRDELDREAWRDLLVQMNKDVADSTPWWRRALGFVYPWSWLRVR
jgi:transglutaminase-like putative cysteine protease